ncbi:MAG: PAS domain-containing protein [Anaerolineales bacterium]|nr:PAS domain-containing protein [Anaerolineales bacterium]
MNHSEKKATKQSFKKALCHHDPILDSVSDMLIFLDREFCVQWANPIAAETAEMQLEEMLGKHCYKIGCTQDYPCENCRLQKVFDQREIHEHEGITPIGRIWRVKSSPICGGMKMR